MYTTRSNRHGWMLDTNFQKDLDLNMQLSRNESLRIETFDLPKLSANLKTMNGGYSNCTNECGCKSCQRQMKRPNGDMTPCRTADKSVSSPEMSSFSSSSSFSSMLSPLSPPSTPLFSPLQQQRVTTNTPTQTHTQRKKPSLRSYEKHLPKPVYSQEDSIYRIEDETYASSIKQQEEVDNNKSSTCSSFSSSTSSSSSRRPDRYEISWKDESGDDMLPSLVTFTTIIEEKGDENPEGLSDFLEQRTRELKDQNYSQKGTNISSVTLSPNPSQLSVFKLPPRTLDCLTLSYRIGSRHHPLTLFDTMKMPNRFDRMDAYGTAFQECMNSNTGLNVFVTKNRMPPVRERSKVVPIARKPTLKRSLLYPLSPSSRKPKASEDLKSPSELETPISTSTRNFPFEISSPIQNNTTSDTNIASVINNNNGLFPSMTQFKSIPPNKYHEQQQADFLNRSYTDLKDSSSISSSDSSKTSQTRRPSRLLSSLGRKASSRSHKSTSNKSVDYEQPSPNRQTFH